MNWLYLPETASRIDIYTRYFLFDIGFKETYINKFTGEVREIRKRTRDLNKSEFSELTQQVMQWAAEHGIPIMTPQEYFET